MATKKANVTLWGVQSLLAALFLFAGSIKLVMPIDAMTQQIGLPGWFIRFIGVCEVLGAIGLILPIALHILPVLTPIAASGLVIVMAGATIITASGQPAQAIMPLIVGMLCAVVVYFRRPHISR